jgi:hypothetical protein
MRHSMVTTIAVNADNLNILVFEKRSENHFCAICRQLNDRLRGNILGENVFK